MMVHLFHLVSFRKEGRAHADALIKVESDGHSLYSPELVIDHWEIS